MEILQNAFLVGLAVLSTLQTFRLNRVQTRLERLEEVNDRRFE